MPSLKFYLFGAPRLERLSSERSESIGVRRRKGLALLAYLTTSERAHNRDALATLLWPDSDQAGARANLRRDLSRLQQDLGADALLAEHDLIGVKDGALWCDVLTFRELLARVAEHGHPQAAVQMAGVAGELCQDCVHWLQEAVALYGGDFMAGFTLPDSLAFEEWQLFQTERLRRAYGRALQQLLKWHSDGGEYEQALGYASRWLALDPLHEGAQRQMMRLYAWSGETAAALRQYKECARVLQEELGVSPAPETVELYEAIRKQSLPQPTAAAATRSSRKAPVAVLSAVAATRGGLLIPFVGRRAELDRLVAALERASEGEGQTILLEGEPGIGKSRLVQEAARYGAQRGFGVLLGKCYQGEESMPYQVVMGLLDQVLANWSDEPLAQLAPGALAELALLAPEIGARFPELPQLPRGLEAGEYV